MDQIELLRLFEQRRKQLTEVYKKDLKVTKQHQVYGAIKEIDLFLEVLRHYTHDVPETPKIQQKGLARLKQLVEEKLISN